MSKTERSELQGWIENQLSRWSPKHGKGYLDVFKALSIAVEELEVNSKRADGIKPGVIDYKNCFQNSKWGSKDALRRIEELGK